MYPGMMSCLSAFFAATRGRIRGMVALCMISLFVFPALVLAWQAPGPAITPNGGNFSAPVQVTLSARLPGVEIHYTTDFYQQPTMASPVYTGPFTIDSKATVRAAGFQSGVAVTGVSAANFSFFRPEVMNAEYDWQPQPEKAALMIVFAHR
jgi:hypothetical protein